MGRTELLGKEANFNTTLSSIIVGSIIKTFGKYGVEVKDIHDNGTGYEMTTSHGTIDFTEKDNEESIIRRLRNERYNLLNKRFDARVELLKSKGYIYSKEHRCFATSDKSASNGCGISNGIIMHADDLIFGRYIETF